MEEKQSPKFDQEPHAGGGSLKPKMQEFGRRFFVFTKFILGLCLLPFVYSATVSFLRQFGLLDQSVQDYFWTGVISLVIIYFFIWEPALIYSKGQKLLELVFSFFKPLVKVAPFVLPIYTLVLLVIYAAFSWCLSDYLVYFMFLFGFTLALHLVFGAKSMRSKKDDFFKSNYLFGFSLVYLINIFSFAFFLNIIFDKFSFVNFCNVSYRIAHGIVSAVCTQLFVTK